jgi:hypothetical protein
MLPPGSLQLLVARCCLPSILEAMLRHADEPEVVGKAMVLLGVLAQASRGGGGVPPAGRAACRRSGSSWRQPRPHAGQPAAAPVGRTPLPALPSCSRPAHHAPPGVDAAQGEEEVHEAIRRTLVERTPFPRIAARVLSDLWTLDGDGWAAAAGWERWGRCLPASLLHPGSQLLPRIASARCCCPVKERSGAPLCVDPCVVGPDAHDA